VETVDGTHLLDQDCWQNVKISLPNQDWQECLARSRMMPWPLLAVPEVELLVISSGVARIWYEGRGFKRK